MSTVQRCQDRQAEIFREPAGDRIRDIEILDWQVGQQGFNDPAGDAAGRSGIAVTRATAPTYRPSAVNRGKSMQQCSKGLP